ncbi:phycobilisome rod-core linker polypeptide [Planktothrix sp. FACHB-1365]|uniref:phycobilisome rod-core linker polypeptide n=1 Tax=Planktothrix sp. FACHB-1365 TaxID=2692855 RepID=UPI0016873AF3|nr:phycobilisome rod-core linker polypeptide [Planktothrix sp. FACHB-1365]MBD2485000.1 phycobilisome rod-core linker polypeptide [Planktothrix sp. FACHB-1365]
MTLTQPVTTRHDASPEEREFVLKQIYQQVLERQLYESERKHLADLEKDFIKGKIGIRHFLKSLAVRPIYLELFYENSSNMKFIENACKHFLGRAPKNNQELHEWDDILVRHGVGALVSELVDSEEYRKSFGYFTIPYWHEHRFESASEYIENEKLGHEHAGQRGWAIPTHYQHELHIDCDGGTCVREEDKFQVQQVSPIEEVLDLSADTKMTPKHIQRLSLCVKEIAEILAFYPQPVSLKEIETDLQQKVLEYVSITNANLLFKN